MADLLLQSLFARGASAAPSQQLSVEEQQDAWEQSEQQWGEAAEPWAGPEEGEEPGGDGGEAGDGGECGGIDMDVSSAEVLRRIHSTALWFVSELCSGRLPEIEVASRAAANRALARADGEDEDGGGGGAQWVMRLQAQTQRRALLGRHPESAEQVARLFALLELVQQLLLTGAQATQREVWYKLKTLEIFRSPRDVNEAVQDAVCMLQVPRSALGITASSKGLVAGRLVIHDQRSGTETDCAAEGGGVQIPGDIARICRDFAFQTDAQVVLVVEKDAVFQRLVQQRFFDAVPAVLITGKGVPDLSTRAFLAGLSSAFPDLPLVGLVDWNPAGVNILSIYKFGSHRMGLESPHYALPSLGWLGARSSQLRQADADAFQARMGGCGHLWELTSRDCAQAANLSAALAGACPEWAAELQEMLSSGSKAEIEALDTVDDLADLLARFLEEGDCV